MIAVKKVKTHKTVSFRPDNRVAMLIHRLDSVGAINRSEVLNRAMLLGLPEVLAQIARDASGLVDKH